MASPKPLAPAPSSSYHEPDKLGAVIPAKNATVACSECRRRKSKCVGGPPCEACRNNNTTCILDQESDGRRKISLKRKMESLEKDRELLLGLVKTLRSHDKRKSTKLFEIIQDSGSLEDIRQCITECESLSDAEQQVNSRFKFMDVKRITDIPLYNVPAAPWTAVTDDSEFVSHLISVYLTWNNSVFHWIDHDLFIRDMKSGNLNSKFCSPLLVNSILAVACFYSDYPETLAVPGDPTSKGLHFYNEARRLLDNHSGKPTLTSFQALGSVYTTTCTIGKDRLGWQYLMEIGQAARDIIKQRDRLISGAGDKGHEMQRAVDTAVYGLFNLTPIATISLSKPCVMKKPKMQPLPQDHNPNDTWSSYPMQSPTVAAHRNCLTNTLFKLQLIVWDITDYFFGDEEKPPYSDMERTVPGFHQRLEEWSQQLPECVGFGSTATPGIMDMHLRYYSAILTMFGFIKNPPKNYQPDDALIQLAKEQCLGSAYRIRDILNIHRARWPLQYMPMPSMQYFTIALFTLIEDLDGPHSGDAFMDLCIGLHALACRWLLAKGMLRLVHVTVKQTQIQLTDEMARFFHDFEENLWSVEDREQFSSLYPSFALTINPSDEADDAELDKFLEKWDDLTLSAE